MKNIHIINCTLYEVDARLRNGRVSLPPANLQDVDARAARNHDRFQATLDQRELWLLIPATLAVLWGGGFVVYALVNLVMN